LPESVGAKIACNALSFAESPIWPTTRLDVEIFFFGISSMLI
jgi:hypothetical protein